MKQWVMAGPTHHFALGIGHHAQELERIAKILSIESIVIR